MKKLLSLATFFAVLLNSSSFAQLQNTGWRRPAATHFPNDWTNPQNAFGSDDLYAEVLHQSGCRCPFMDLSWDNGVNFTSSVIFGPYGTSDSFKIQGDSTDNWGHTWTETDLTDSVFLIRIWNSSTLLKQGYVNFAFGIPSGSSIMGIEVRVEAHGDSSYFMDFVDNIEVRVYYYLPTPVNEVYSADRVVNIFPNPANHSIHFRFEHNASGLKAQLVNVQGKIITESFFATIHAGIDYTMDVSRFSPGIYFLNIIGESKTVNARVVLE